MQFSDCLSSHDTKSDGDQTACASTSDYHTAYEKSEICQEDESNNMTNDQTMEHTDSMSENDKPELHQESFINSSRRDSICDASVDLDINNVDVSLISKNGS